LAQSTKTEAISDKRSTHIGVHGGVGVQHPLQFWARTAKAKQFVTGAELRLFLDECRCAHASYCS
jgi:hypothetical protein